MNNVVLVGRLVRDPLIMGSEDIVAAFTLAVNNPYKPDSADFIECKSFNKTANLIEQYVAKGTKIAVSGSLHSYQYDKDGVTRYGTEVIVSSFEFCERKQEPEDKNKQSRGKNYRK